MPKRIELQIEEACRDWVEELGGRLIKTETPGTRGFVDRLLLLPGVPITIFVEFKRPGERPRASQRRWHRELRALCKTTWVIDDPFDFVERTDAVRAHWGATDCRPREDASC